MRQDWKKVRLAEVLSRSEEIIVPEADRQYQEITVKLWGKGVVRRRMVTGAELAGQRRYVTRRDQLILSRIDARNGALGIVPPELDVAVVSNDFPTFQVREDCLSPTYLGWLCRTAGFVEECKRASEGTTNRVRLQEDKFLSGEIALPPLAEQRRVVARIEEAAAKIDEARVLRQRALEEADRILEAEELRIWPQEELQDAPTLESLTVFLARGRQSEQGASDHFLIKTQHVQQGRYVPTVLRLAHHAAAKVNREATAMEGDILIACSAAGCLGRVARYHDGGRIASTDTHVAIARPRSSAVDAEYLYVYLRGARGQRQLRSRERGDWQREKIGFRLTELNLKDLRLVPVPLPDRSQQRRTVAELGALHGRVDALKRLQAETSVELDALLPSILDRAFKGKL